MRVAGTKDADERSVNEVMGFIWRLATVSGAHLTDYVVDAGTVDMFAGSGRAAILLAQCKKVGLLTQLKVSGVLHYKIIEDPDFLHLRLKAEIEWERQQKADLRNPALSVPVRARDGDGCRYCGVVVMWRGAPSKRSGTLDHLVPGQPATVDTLVVACRGCNSGLRDISGIERDQPQAVPANPYYSKYTAGWLTDNGRPTDSTERPDSQSDTATRATRKGKTGQRSGSQPATAPGQRPEPSDPAPGDSDPATATAAGHRAPESELQSASESVDQVLGTDSGGPGRVGSGSAPPLPNPAGTARGQPRAQPQGGPRGQPRGQQRSRRSRRGRRNR